ncbi:MAG: general secretion pathway protein GspE, partial [Deltaproteobacteria bacterium]|nr:general secretion pathway protein GspE [Deltaproteobacteria bacterium]
MGATPRNRVAEILIRAKVIDDMQSRSAQAHVERWGLRFTAALVDLGLADEELMVEKLCAGTGTKRANLGMWQKDENVLGMIEVEVCEEKGVFPMGVKNRVLTLAMANPTDVITIDELVRETKVSRIQVMTAGERELLTAISRHYHGVEPQLNQQMIRKQTRSENPDELPPEDEEFKVTDMSG